MSFTARRAVAGAYAPAMSSRVVHATTLPLDPAPLDDHQLVGADPGVATAAIATLPGGAAEVGVWEHGAGTSTDVEAEEVFVVLSGRATVRVEGGETLELGPGDVGVLEAGARTVWTVHETLRKVYVVTA
jgi:uncharacterized cupin superfamily protein